MLWASGTPRQPRWRARTVLGMFRHVVLLRWKPGTPGGHGEELAAALAGLRERAIPFRSYVFGPDLGLTGPPNGFDFAIVGEFDDRAGWDVYMADGEHDRIRAELLAPHVEGRATAQFEA
jgi:hypothetical protein